MIINRRTFNIKPGCMEETIQLIKDAGAVVVPGPQANSFKVSTAIFGPFDVLAMEVEFDDMAHYQKYWDEVFGLPHMVNFFDTWNKLVDGGGTNEIWEVAQ